jgi:hypothetical protein
MMLDLLKLAALLKSIDIPGFANLDRAQRAYPNMSIFRARFPDLVNRASPVSLVGKAEL